MRIILTLGWPVGRVEADDDVRVLLLWVDVSSDILLPGLDLLSDLLDGVPPLPRVSLDLPVPLQLLVGVEIDLQIKDIPELLG